MVGNGGSEIYGFGAGGVVVGVGVGCFPGPAGRVGGNRPGRNLARRVALSLAASGHCRLAAFRMSRQVVGAMVPVTARLSCTTAGKARSNTDRARNLKLRIFDEVALDMLF